MKLKLHRNTTGIGLFQLGIETYRDVDEFHFNYGATQEVDHGRVWSIFLGLWVLAIRPASTTGSEQP